MPAVPDRCRTGMRRRRRADRGECRRRDPVRHARQSAKPGEEPGDEQFGQG